MPALTKLCRRFASSTRGIAAVEFAMIVPVLLLLFLASFDAGRAIAAYMKVKAATFTVAAIANQYTTSTNGIQTADMTTITGSSAAVLAPYCSSVVCPQLVTTITQVKATSLTVARVSWSYSLNGSAYTAGATWTLPPNFTTQYTAPSGGTVSGACNSFPCYYLVAEVSYTYTPMFGSFVTGPIALTDNAYVTPRSSVCVQYNNVPSTC
jgi:Flp pilus assembly protein TadG